MILEVCVEQKHHSGRTNRTTTSRAHNQKRNTSYSAYVYSLSRQSCFPISVSWAASRHQSGTMSKVSPSDAFPTKPVLFKEQSEPIRWRWFFQLEFVCERESVSGGDVIDELLDRHECTMSATLMKEEHVSAWRRAIRRASRV
jgi:hypothetical protein